MSDRADERSWSEVLGAGVRGRRRRLGLTQHDVAALAGCADRFVHELEHGKATARLDKVVAVLGVLGLALRIVTGPEGIAVAVDA